jgi:hypothetical protein
VIEAVAQLPGVLAAGVGGSPLGLTTGLGSVTLPGETRELPMVGLGPVSVGYFEALGVRLKVGRLFTPDDRAGAPVAIVSESTAQEFWPSTALGPGPRRSRVCHPRPPWRSTPSSACAANNRRWSG